MIAEEEDIAKAMLAKAASRTLKDGFEGRRGHGHRSREPHVPGRWADRTFWHIADDGRNDRVPQRLGNTLTQRQYASVVFAQSELRSTLLRAANGNQRGFDTAVDLVAQLHGGQVL